MYNFILSLFFKHNGMYCTKKIKNKNCLCSKTPLAVRDFGLLNYDLGWGGDI